MKNNLIKGKRGRTDDEKIRRGVEREYGRWRTKGKENW